MADCIQTQLQLVSNGNGSGTFSDITVPSTQVSTTLTIRMVAADIATNSGVVEYIVLTYICY